MIFICAKCNTEFTCKNDEAARSDGHRILCFNLHDNTRLINCHICLEFIDKNREKLLNKIKDKVKNVTQKIFPKTMPKIITEIIPAREKTRNELMFEKII